MGNSFDEGFEEWHGVRETGRGVRVRGEGV